MTRQVFPLRLQFRDEPRWICVASTSKSTREPSGSSLVATVAAFLCRKITTTQPQVCSMADIQQIWYTVHVKIRLWSGFLMNFEVSKHKCFQERLHIHQCMNPFFKYYHIRKQGHSIYSPRCLLHILKRWLSAKSPVEINFWHHDGALMIHNWCLIGWFVDTWLIVGWVIHNCFSPQLERWEMLLWISSMWIYKQQPKQPFGVFLPWSTIANHNSTTSC